MATFIGNGVVWDKENNKVLCRFVNGEFKTVDKEVADKLLKLGYAGFKDEAELEAGNETENTDETEEKKEETSEKETPKKARR